MAVCSTSSITTCSVLNSFFFYTILSCKCTVHHGFSCYDERVLHSGSCIMFRAFCALLLARQLTHVMCIIAIVEVIRIPRNTLHRLLLQE